MFSALQVEYLQSMAHTMREQGFPYYLAVTQWRSVVTQPNMVVYFSRNPIIATGMYSYTINTAVRYSINFSAFNNTTNTGPRFTVTDVGNVTRAFATHEFIYTNADFGTMTRVQPDILLQEGGNLRANQVSALLISILFFTILFIRIFR